MKVLIVSAFALLVANAGLAQTAAEEVLPYPADQAYGAEEQGYAEEQQGYAADDQGYAAPAAVEEVPSLEQGYAESTEELDCAGLSEAECEERIKTRFTKRFQHEELVEQQHRRRIIEDRYITEEHNVDVKIQPRVITDREIRKHVTRKTIKRYTMLPAIYEQGQTVVSESEPVDVVVEGCVPQFNPCATPAPCPVVPQCLPTTCPPRGTFWDRQPPNMPASPYYQPTGPLLVPRCGPALIIRSCHHSRVMVNAIAGFAQSGRHFPASVTPQGDLVFSGRAAHNMRDVLVMTFGNQSIPGLIEKSANAQQQVLRFDRVVRDQAAVNTLVGNMAVAANNEGMMRRFPGRLF